MLYLVKQLCNLNIRNSGVQLMIRSATISVDEFGSDFGVLLLGQARNMYEFIWLNDKLVFVKLHENMLSDSTREFVKEFYKLLNQSKTPVYVLTDLRRGRIGDIQAFSRIKFLTQHKSWAGSVAFCNNPISDISNTKFQSLTRSQQNKDMIFNIPEEAIAYLELLEPGLTDGIQWSEVL